jgi:hypothetical protein
LAVEADLPMPLPMAAPSMDNDNGQVLGGSQSQGEGADTLRIIAAHIFDIAAIGN